MKKRPLIAFCICLLFLMSHAQSPHELLNNWSAQSPIEKIYFHADRNDYIAGQTIWFKGYLYSDFLPANKSTSLYVELLNLSSTVVSRQVLPVFAGFTRGQIELPDTLTGGTYMLRAYTTTMLNHHLDFLYKKQFFIFNKKKKIESTAVMPKATKLEFFPEGGNFISGLSNSIAFKATGETGLPVAVDGIIKNEDGQQVAIFSSYHDGMGYFDLVAEEANTYYAILNNDPSGQKYYLPSPTRKGVVLRIMNAGKIKQFEILQRKDDPVFRASYMIGQMQHHVVFKAQLKQNEDELTGMIRTENLSSGIMHITVFNKDGLPLAERLTFIDNREYIQQGELLLDTLNFSERGKNRFTLLLKDTVKGSFSVSVSEPAFESSSRQENIFSGLLLTSDIKGYVHNPAYYFSAVNDSVQNALDLVMMTNGWRRFRWSELPRDNITTKKYSDTGYITLTGKINVQGTKRPFADKDILMYIITTDSGRNMQMVHTDAEGRFRTDSIVFFDRARILFSDIRGKKNEFIDVILGNDSLHKKYSLPKMTTNDLYQTDTLTSSLQKIFLDEHTAIAKAEGVMLEEVVLESQKKTKQEEFEEKYVSALFSGEASRKMYLEEEELTPYPNIFDYLRSRVPGLTVLEPNYENEPGNSPDIRGGGGPGYRIFYRQNPSMSSLGNIPMTLYLDETETESNIIATLPANQIAMVKVFNNFVAASGNGAGGVLAIYTKRGFDLANSLPSATDILQYNGYSVIKEFYSPDAVSIKNKSKQDQRITLYWNPLIFIDGVNSRFPLRFYNNDRTKQFKVVIEGMTADGKMLMIEKLIAPAKPF